MSKNINCLVDHKGAACTCDLSMYERPMSNSTQNEPIINGEWDSPAPYKVNRWVKKDSTQNDWAKKLSSLIDDTIENRHDYKGSLVVEDDILFERLNENLKLFVTTLLADARREVIDEIEIWTKESLQNGNIEEFDCLKELQDVLATLRKG